MIRTIKITLITISMVLFSLSISSFIINIYAQTKGGGVTSGEAIGGEATAIGIAGGFYNNCNQCTIIIAPQATGGAGYQWTGYRRKQR